MPMAAEKLNNLIWQDPVSGGELHVSELASSESGVSIRGRFGIPRYAKLDSDQAMFLETFLRCRGVLNSVERELGISYPTVRARLDALLQALDLQPVKDDVARKDKSAARRKAILDQLERGDITPAEAKAKLKEIVR